MSYELSNKLREAIDLGVENLAKCGITLTGSVTIFDIMRQIQTLSGEPLPPTLDDETIIAYAFQNCDYTDIVLPNATAIEQYAFENSQKLKTVQFNNTVNLAAYAFANCPNLTTIDTKYILYINGQYAFQNCENLTQVIIRNGTSTGTLNNANAFENTPIANGTGYIYVPSKRISNYQSGANWVTYKNQFRVLENYTVDGTTTGALDPNKI